MDIYGKNIFITSCGGLGDLIVCTPALKRLKEKYHCHITFLCQKKYKDILSGLSYVDKVVCIERGKLLGRYRCIWEGKLHKQDAIIFTDWHPILLAAAHLMGVPVVAGIPRAGHRLSSFITNRIYNHVFADTHYAGISNALTYSDALGIALDGDMTNIEMTAPAAEDIAMAAQMLHQIDCELGKYILLAPFAAFEQRNWPIANAREFVGFVEKEFGIPVVVIGMEHNVQAAQQISDHVLAGKTTVLQLAALVKGARLVVSTDSGPLHIAGAMGTPVVALFSKDLPSRWAPARKCWPISLSLPCSPCDDATAVSCKYDLKCMKGITGTRVFEQVKQCLLEI